MTRSALFKYFFARSTPIFSTTSSVSRIPAVSIMFNIIPFKLICSSRTSLVVPAISVTIAFSSPTREFKREDFPAFGFPTITVEIPSFNIFPLSLFASSLSIFFITSDTIPDSFSGYPSRLMCSGSSNALSINAISCKTFPRISLIFSETEPESWLNELFNANSFLELITSITDSACERSILPFKNARFVNSPGSAGRAPYLITVSKILFMT